MANRPKHRTRLFPITGPELENLLRTGAKTEIITGIPEDGIIIGIRPAPQQHAYNILVHSESFPEVGALDIMESSLSSLVIETEQPKKEES